MCAQIAAFAIGTLVGSFFAGEKTKVVVLNNPETEEKIDELEAKIKGQEEKYSILKKENEERELRSKREYDSRLEQFENEHKKLKESVEKDEIMNKKYEEDFIRDKEKEQEFKKKKETRLRKEKDDFEKIKKEKEEEFYAKNKSEIHKFLKAQIMEEPNFLPFFDEAIVLNSSELEKNICEFHENNVNISLGHAKSPYLNVVVLGQTGIGKSTLVNEMLGENKAKADIGDAVTKMTNEYISEKIKGLRIYDTEGIELDADERKNSINKLKNTIKDLIQENLDQKSQDKYIHCLWYCTTGDRFEDTEVKTMKELSAEYENGIPIIIIYTQAYDEEQDTENINIIKKKWKEVKYGNVTQDDPQVCCVVAKERKFKNITVPKRGIEKLIQLTTNQLEHSVESAVIAGCQKKGKKEFRERLHQINQKLKDFKFSSSDLSSNEKKKNHIKNVLKEIFKKFFINADQLINELNQLFENLSSEVVDKYNKIFESSFKECSNKFGTSLGGEIEEEQRKGERECNQEFLEHRSLRDWEKFYKEQITKKFKQEFCETCFNDVAKQFANKIIPKFVEIFEKKQESLNHVISSSYKTKTKCRTLIDDTIKEIRNNFYIIGR